MGENQDSNLRKNLAMPGNPRYQPKAMIPFFGYDHLYSYVGEVEYAAIETAFEIYVQAGIISEETKELLDDKVLEAMKIIVTSTVDKIERQETKHDVLAIIKEIKNQLPEDAKPLGNYLHLMLTSYDALDTATALRFQLSYEKAIKPALIELAETLAGMAETYSGTLQIGRTHGQHALPITVGFWLATILNRIIYNWQRLDEYSFGLIGKISGAVGASNAYIGLGFDRYLSAEEFEERVLGKLGLKPALISTQIVQPEPLAYFLYSATMLSASLAQFGTDCRQLMRSEIGEIQEEFSDKQGGSSTMAHKRNPINFENLCGTWLKNKNEFGKVLDTLISEHQRDLTGSSVARDFPVILINLQQQLDTLLRKNDDGVSFLKRIRVNKESLGRNLAASKDYILAEPMYIALQLYGGMDNAHHFVNHQLVPFAKAENITLIKALELKAQEDCLALEAYEKIPGEIIKLFWNPDAYIGRAQEKTLAVVHMAREIIEFIRIEKP